MSNVFPITHEQFVAAYARMKMKPSFVFHYSRSTIPATASPLMVLALDILDQDGGRFLTIDATVHRYLHEIIAGIVGISYVQSYAFQDGWLQKPYNPRGETLGMQLRAWEAGMNERQLFEDETA